MMGKYCGCFHHKILMILSGLVFFSGLAFFWTAFSEAYTASREGLLFGFPAPFYFEAAVILALMGWGMKGCRCCYGGNKCGTSECGTRKVGDHGVSGEEASMCKHEGGCKCGDCGRCK